jgi:hypothetical protein
MPREAFVLAIRGFGNKCLILFPRVQYEAEWTRKCEIQIPKESVPVGCHFAFFQRTFLKNGVVLRALVLFPRLFFFFSTGDGVYSLVHARQVLYH